MESIQYYIGKLVPYSSMYVAQQGPTHLKTQEEFFESAVKERDRKTRQSETRTKTEKENASHGVYLNAVHQVVLWSVTHMKSWRSVLILASTIE